mgnify:FL=1
MTKKSKYQSTVPAVDQSLKLLNFMAENSATSMTLTEICERLDIHKSRVYTILNTLIGYDFVQKNPRTKTYRLGLGIVHLARNILNNLDIRDIVKTPLRQLAMETELTAHFGQIVGSNFYIISKEEGNADVGYNMRIGISHDITHGAHGKAIVAFMPESERQEILSRDYLCFYGDGQPFDMDDLLTELEEARINGYATDLRATNPNIIAISSPVFDGDETIDGGIILIGAFSRGKLKSYGARVANAAIGISHDLGYRSTLPFS